MGKRKLCKQVVEFVNHGRKYLYSYGGSSPECEHPLSGVTESGDRKDATHFSSRHTQTKFPSTLISSPSTLYVPWAVDIENVMLSFLEKSDTERENMGCITAWG